jgi:hypothetical protein
MKTRRTTAKIRVAAAVKPTFDETSFYGYFGILVGIVSLYTLFFGNL